MAGSNERLRKAMHEAQLTAEELAQAVGVSTKSVYRWLSGQVPYPRLRWAVAKRLNEDQRYLWPEAERTVVPGLAATSEVVAAYAHRADVSVEAWWELFVAAKRRIDLIAYAMLFLPESHPRLLDLLRGKAAAGCRIRIAFGDPESHQVVERDAEEGLNGGLVARIKTAMRYFGAVAGCDGIEIHSYAAAMYNGVFRFDDEMFVTPFLYGTPGYRAPLLHLRRLGEDGIFDSFAGHVEDVWRISKPVQYEA